MVMFHIPYLIFMLTYLASIQPILGIALLLIFIPMTVSQMLKRTIFSKAEDEVTPLRRVFDEYWQSICGKAYLKETRALGIFQFLKERFVNNMLNMNERIWKAELKSGLIEFGVRMATLFGYLLILILLIIFSVNGNITVGEFAAIFSSIGLAFSIMQGIIDRNLGYASKNIGYAKNFVEFLGLPEMRERHELNAGNKDVRLSNVYFQYLQADTCALKNVTLSLKDKETIAIVGANGSGKTTLAKVLMGIYPPTKGEVNTMSCDTKEALPYNAISTVFQKYNRYHLSLNDNIKISDPDSTSQSVDDIANKVGLDTSNSSFPDGFDTILSTEFNGVDLSGG
jgi:ATP-binding cassette subfamily B protein